VATAHRLDGMISGGRGHDDHRRLGRLTLSRRERVVMIEPRGTGMALFTLRAADEVRAPRFTSAEGDLDSEVVAIAAAIIRQRTGKFDPSTFRDRYQDALRELIEAKMQRLAIKRRAVPTPAPVIELMAALKRSLAEETHAAKRAATKSRSTKATPDRRQAALLLPLSGGKNGKPKPQANHPPPCRSAAGRCDFVRPLPCEHAARPYRTSPDVTNRVGYWHGKVEANPTETTRGRRHMGVLRVALNIRCNHDFLRRHPPSHLSQNAEKTQIASQLGEC